MTNSDPWVGHGGQAGANARQMKKTSMKFRSLDGARKSGSRPSARQSPPSRLCCTHLKAWSTAHSALLNMAPSKRESLSVVGLGAWASSLPPLVAGDWQHLRLSPALHPFCAFGRGQTELCSESSVPPRQNATFVAVGGRASILCVSSRPNGAFFGMERLASTKCHVSGPPNPEKVGPGRGGFQIYIYMYICIYIK